MAAHGLAGASKHVELERLTADEVRAMKVMGEMRIAQLAQIENRYRLSSPAIVQRAQDQIDLLVSALTKLAI